MNTRKILAFVLFAASAVGSAAAVGCNSNSSNSTRHSALGEECTMTADCNDGLSCVPRSVGGGVCVQGQFKVAPTAKECAVIQCSQASDCCPTPSASCNSEKTLCSQGDQTACNFYNTNCVCNASKYTCDNGTCNSHCTTTTDCGGIGTCTNGQCVQCTDDTQCTGGNVCNNNLCTPPCMSDTDCSSFNRCTDGKCTASGCATDRECIAATKNVTATCKDNACVVPCQTDLECGNPEDYKFYSCIKNQCIYVGCDTDKECQLYLGAAGTGTGTNHGQIVCRDKTQ